MINLHLGDCRELAPKFVAPGSVDLIFTDPPYPKEYLPLYTWLAQEADRVLKPDGFLISYAGPYWKDAVMRRLGKQLDYFYDFVLIHNCNTSMLWRRRIISGYKSLLCYHKKGRHPLPVTNVLGKFNGSGSDKRFHRWGQDESSAEYYIDLFSRPGDLVVDFFVGGGTNAIMCKRLDRQFIGFECDNAAFEMARARVDEIPSPQKSEQLSLIDRNQQGGRV